MDVLLHTTTMHPGLRVSLKLYISMRKQEYQIWVHRMVAGYGRMRIAGRAPTQPAAEQLYAAKIAALRRDMQEMREGGPLVRGRNQGC